MLTLALPSYLWSRKEYYTSNLLEELYTNHNDNIERVEYDNVSKDEFYERFQKTNTPCVIKGVTKDWEVENNWSWNVIKSNLFVRHLLRSTIRRG